jgi:lysozyme
VANENMRMSSAGYALLRFNEGVVMHYYNDAPRNGNCTWGIGTLAHLGPCTQEELNRTVLPQQANSILHHRVHDAERTVRATVTRHQLTQAQFDAAVSFAYNSRAFDINRTLTPANSGNMTEVAARMRRNVLVVPRDRRGHVLGPGRIVTGCQRARNADRGRVVTYLVRGVLLLVL